MSWRSVSGRRSAAILVPLGTNLSPNAVSRSAAISFAISFIPVVTLTPASRRTGPWLTTVSLRVMRRELQTPQSPVPPTPTDMSPIEDAFAEIESLRPIESICHTNVAKKNVIWRSTLTRRHQAATISIASKSINQRKLGEQKEQELVRCIARLTKQGLTSIKALIQNFASDVAKSPVSESWVTRFIGRHSIDLISKWTAGTDNNRHQADLGAKYSL
jgi:hypothetical protein